MKKQLRWAIGLAVFVLCAPVVRGDDWPQWMGPKRDGVWSETGILDTFPKDGPKILWRAKVSGGYGGPSVANGKVYVMDFVTDADNKGEIYERPKISGQERVLCFSADKGELVWEHKYDCNYAISFPNGPRVTPTVVDGKVYTVGAEGNLFCLDAEKGKVIWSKEFKKDYTAKTPIWGFCGHPLVVGKTVYVITGGDGACVVAFDKDNGKEMWKALTAEEPGYSCPTLIEAGGVKQLLIWHATSVNSLNPDTGEKYWTVPLKCEYKMSIMSPRQLGDFLFVGGIYDQSVLLKLAKDKPAVTEVWRGKKTTSIGPVSMTPFLVDGHIYGVHQQGQLTAVKMETGERLWDTTDPVTGKGSKPLDSATAFIIKNGDRYFLFNELGELVIAKLSPKGYEEVSRAKVIEQTNLAFNRSVVWSHPAFANKCAYIRNDKEIICVSLAK
jgi:outer membrane protein assembly factor BamB